MTLTTTGPKPVDQSFASGIHGNIMDRLTRRDWLINKHQAEKLRIKTVTNVANGNWHVEWPDLAQTPEAPSVANLIEMGIGHWAAVGGAILPSIRVPVNATENRSEGKRGARKRERRIRELLEESNASSLASLLWGDYAGAGSAVAGVWANFEEKDLSKRNPFMVRYDPRTTYILKDHIGNITEMLVAHKLSEAEMKAMFVGTNYERTFAKSREEDVEEWFWYTKDKFLHAVVDVSSDGRKGQRWVTLAEVDNKLGFVPAWEATRPTFDGQRRGVFDQTIHLLRTMHRLMVMTIYSTEEHAFPTVAAYDAVNAEDFGPGAIIQLRSSEGRIERVGPSSHFDVKDLIARIGEDANRNAVYPQQLSGDPGASITSARGIQASMGGLDARLAVAHKQFEVLFSKIGGFMLAFDEMFCDGEKTITGDSREDSKAENYLPSRDVNGEWKAIATYGIGAGSDPNNVEVRLSMHQASGLLSKETARNHLPFLEDPDQEPVNIMREAMADAIVAGVMAQAQQGGPEMAAKVYQLLTSNDLDFDEVMAKVIELVAPETPPDAAAGASAGGALGALQGAESLARGGIPGNAEQAPPASLPPLGQLMGQDARLVS